MRVNFGAENKNHLPQTGQAVAAVGVASAGHYSIIRQGLKEGRRL
jgi:hypothetical protein